MSSYGHYSYRNNIRSPEKYDNEHYTYRNNIRSPEKQDSDNDYYTYKGNIRPSERYYSAPERYNNNDEDDASLFSSAYRNRIGSSEKEIDYTQPSIREILLPQITDINFTHNNGDNWINRYPNDLERLKLLTSHEKFTTEGATSLYYTLCGKVEELLPENEKDNIDGIFKNLKSSDITPEYIKQEIP